MVPFSPRVSSKSYRFFQKRRFYGRYVFAFLCLASFLYLFGFYHFARHIPARPGFEVLTDSGAPEPPFVLGVVFTGAPGRIRAGYDLLQQGIVRRLFISGVQNGVEVKTLINYSTQDPNRTACCVKLGYDADSTWENVQEVKTLLGPETEDAILLITSYYHVPRSGLLLKNALPDHALYAYPVMSDLDPDWWQKSPGLRVALSEYNKFLVQWVLVFFV